MTKVLCLTLCCLVITVQHAQTGGTLKPMLESRGGELLLQAKGNRSMSAQGTFLNFVDVVARELVKAGDKETAARITNAVVDPSGLAQARSDIAWITHTFAREFYKNDIIRETAELVRFKTYATHVPNRENPEFIKQKEYLRSLAEKLGLNFKDVDGYVQEVWIGDGKQSFGLMSHSDVQAVDTSEWSHDPWSGDVIDNAIWGRGSVDDKGPIVAVMYGMRSILDSGFPLAKRIVLLIGTDEESANEDVKTYLQSHPAPDQTIVVDSNFPVVCAEKGWGGYWLHLPRESSSGTGEGLTITRLESGFSPSIVPAKATATLLPRGVTLSDAQRMVAGKAADFMKRRKGARIDVEGKGESLVVTAWGQSVHSGIPTTGHNALMDLLVFLDRHLKVAENSFSIMAKFAATYIGFELDGKSLGIAHHDDFMGDLTVAANMFRAGDSTLTFMFNLRIPRGIEKASIQQAVLSRIEEFGKKYGVKISFDLYLDEPLYTDPTSPFVERLLGIYNDVTGEHRSAQSMSGGSYAKRLPNAVVFGPALPDEEYLGHQPDEHFMISTLMRNIELLTHAMVEFGM